MEEVVHRCLEWVMVHSLGKFAVVFSSRRETVYVLGG